MLNFRCVEIRFSKWILVGCKQLSFLNFHRSRATWNPNYLQHLAEWAHKSLASSSGKPAIKWNGEQASLHLNAYHFISKECYCFNFHNLRIRFHCAMRNIVRTCFVSRLYLLLVPPSQGARTEWIRRSANDYKMQNNIFCFTHFDAKSSRNYERVNSHLRARFFQLCGFLPNTSEELNHFWGYVISVRKHSRFKTTELLSYM